VSTQTVAAAAALARADRILVIGCPGVGKTTFAGKLGALLRLPVQHLDEAYFGPGWRTPEVEDWHSTVRALCEPPAWIIDGNHQSAMEPRLRRAQVVVLLNRAPALCLASYLRRVLHYATCRYETLPRHMRLGDGRRRAVDRPLRFARFILSFRRRTLAEMSAVLDDYGIPVFELRTRAESGRLLASLEAGPAC
jgi:hypothetical protein